MSPDVFGYAVIAVCGVITAAITTIKMRHSAQATEPGDVDHDLVNVVTSMNRRLRSAEGKIEDLEGQNASQQDQLTAQRAQIDQQAGDISVLQRALEVWRAWHEDIVRRWHVVRQSETPPAAPSDDLGGTLTRYQTEHE